MYGSGPGLPFIRGLPGTSTGRTAVRTAPFGSVGTEDTCSKTQTQTRAATPAPIPGKGTNGKVTAAKVSVE